MTMTTTIDRTEHDKCDWFAWGDGEGCAFDGCTYEAEMADGRTLLVQADVYDAESVGFTEVPNDHDGDWGDPLEEAPKRLRWIGA